MIVYKIMERGDSDSHFKTLFHGNFGSRKIRVGEVVSAQIRESAKDGTSKTTYRSGWHVLPTLEECRDYLSRFSNRLDKLCIVECNISGEIWEKSHSPSNVLLSEKIQIIKEVNTSDGST